MTDFTQYDDAALVNAVLAKEPDAFEEFYRRHRPLVARATSSLCLPDDVEDLVQVVFGGIFDKLSLFNGKSAFSTWLYRVARNTALDELKFRGVAAPTGPEIVSISDMCDIGNGHFQHPSQMAVDATALSAVADAEEIEHLMRAVQRLANPLRQVIHLLLQGCIQAEIAHVLDIPLYTVKYRQSRAIKRLRAILCPAGHTTRGRHA